MSPKKALKNLTTKINVAQKMPKRTVRKEKPKLNMPANIKVSIPFTFTRTDSETMGCGPRNKRQLDPETKLELANEVANGQLTKKTPHKFECAFMNTEQNSAPTITQIEKVGKNLKRGRPKKVISDFFQKRIVIKNSSAEAVVNSAAAKSPEKNASEEKPQRPRRIEAVANSAAAKSPEKNASEEKPQRPRRIVTRKRLADSTANEEQPAKVMKIEPETVHAEIKIEMDPDEVVNTVVSQQPLIVELPPAEEELAQTVVPSNSTVTQPKPRSKRPKPIIVGPPAEEQPQQTVAPSKPTVKQPKPRTKRPKPIIVEPPPIEEEPQLSVVPPKPTVKQPKPRTKRPKPIIADPPPVGDEPQLTDVPPKPTVKQPKPRPRRPKPVQPPQRPRPKAARGNKETQPGKQEKIVETNQSPILAPMRKLPNNDREGDVKIQQVPNTPLPVDSRKTSISSNSNMSWTKDISSSSTTTCITVSSHDFVRFNKKLPILKLTNIDQELKKRPNDVKETSHFEEPDDDSSDTSDSDSSDSERKFSQQLNDSIEVHSLHLSASSAPSSRFSQIRSKESIPDYTKAAEKLTLTMKKIDMEIINWISSENTDVNANLAKFKDKMFDILDNEFGVITHCRRLKEILDPPIIEERIEKPLSSEVIEKSGTNVKEVIENKNPIVETNKDKEVEFAKPNPCRRLSSISDGNFSVASSKSGRGHSSDDNMQGNAKNYDHHDDDDTLSLFAESITGFESTRMNTSIASVPNTKRQSQQVEEYVPKPIREHFVPHNWKPAPVTYCPTKIREDADVIVNKIKTICEKQNADSTSNKQSISTDDAESYQDINDSTAFDSKMAPSEVMKKPQLMESFFEGSPKAKSIVFGNLCFYNLINGCRKIFSGTCRFRHIKPTSDQIKDKVSRLDERSFIQEYLLVRKWPHLRRVYGMCYVEECARRGLTRVLVEMAFDSIVKARNDSAEDTRLRVNTIEITLLHLNNVDLSVCEDLLKLTIHSDKVNRTLLCDVFMATMSITQNFSRFKSVFLNLTYFMVDNDRTFNKDVVEHILERICILPFEEPVARALIQMMRLTKPEIFKNSMLGHFEKQISANKDVFEEYSLLKNHHEFTSMLASSVVAGSPPPVGGPSPAGAPSPACGPSLMAQARPDAAEGSAPAPSPDTTNLDNMNKTAEEPMKPVITRTIGMNPPIVFSRTQSSPCNPGPSGSHNSSGSSNSDDTANQNIRKWRNRAIFPHPQPSTMTSDRTQMRAPLQTPPRPLMRAYMRPPPRMPFNQRLVMYRGPAVCIPDFVPPASYT